MPTCVSGRHPWTNETSAKRCCNGWHRELRIDDPELADDLEARTLVNQLPDAPRAVFVWVKNECQAKEAHER